MQKPVVFVLAVRFEVAELREALFAVRARKCPERLMYGKMCLEISGLRETFLAHGTHKGLFVFVRRNYVILEIRLLHVAFVAVRASMLFLVQVQEVVRVQGACKK